MKLDDYAIQQLAPYLTGHKDHGANLTGRELVELFNRYGGFRDVYDNGLPVIQKRLNNSCMRKNDLCVAHVCHCFDEMSEYSEKCAKIMALLSA